MPEFNLLKSSKIKRIHCMGIGGIGVSGLAQILLSRGYQVTGTDVADSFIINQLREQGANIQLEHNGEVIKDVDALIYSSAIRSDNPEFLAAKNEGIPIIHRGELLAQLINEKIGIAVAGTHGKTTTTALMTYILEVAGLQPSYAIGGVLNDRQTPAHEGNGKYFVAEADESDASFLHMRPHYAIVTNIEADHLDTYHHDFNQLKKSFVDFINHVQSGVAVLDIDDPSIKEMLPLLTPRCITYGSTSDADIYVTQYVQRKLRCAFSIYSKAHQQEFSFELNLPGRHNVSNATAAIAIALELGVDIAAIQSALASFPGVGRRFHFDGCLPVTHGEAFLYNDYGHHPTELSATLTAARAAFPNQRIVVVFQPHRFSRTRDLLGEFASVLAKVDFLVLLDVYSAGEAPIADVNSDVLYSAVKKIADIDSMRISNLGELYSVLTTTLKPNDIVIFQGAGNVGSLASQMIHGGVSNLR